MRRRFMQDSCIDVNRYLTFVARENNTSISLWNYKSIGDGGFSDIQYSINGEHFIEGDVNNIIINSGETLSIKATYHVPRANPDGVFIISRPVDVIGTISSILATPNRYSYIFYNAPIVDASLLSLPATTLWDNCYAYMFHGCTSLTTAPELPATTLAVDCYYNMFYGCSRLTTAPELPATTLIDGCYSSMFQYCTSLTVAPELPATTLADYCYSYMFYGCTSLTTAPALPATTLWDNCYRSMFYGCNNLNYIKMLATGIYATNCLSNWVSGVASSGTFVKNPAMTSLPTGVSGIPSGWTVVDDGEDSGGLITFTIDGVEYQAEEGMTWGEWVNSEYNVNGEFTVDLDDSILYGWSRWVGTEVDYVYASHIIEENYNYAVVV